MNQPENFSFFRLLGHSLAFGLLYALLFFGITNLYYWYFNRRFLYEELIGNQGYMMYDWVGNALGTVTMAVLFVLIEMIRYIVRHRRKNAFA